MGLKLESITLVKPAQIYKYKEISTLTDREKQNPDQILAKYVK